MELESRSLIEPRPKSGYFVSKTSIRKLSLPSVGRLKSSKNAEYPQDLVRSVFETLQDRDIIQFSLGVPDQSMLPLSKLNKRIINAMRRLDGGGIGYEPVQGNANLRRTVAKWSLVLDGKLTEHDLVTTSGTMNSIFNCLIAVTQPGDAIAVESPTYFGILQTAKLLGLNIIEIPSHPISGVDLEAVKKVLPRIKACCFISNFSNPLGCLMPDEHKKELVRILTNQNIPLIEDDIYGNLFFGTERPKPCKAFDEAGIVMWCGSVSKTLAPGYRVGWVAPGKFKEKIIRQKLLQTIASPTLYQEVIADFMEHGRYDYHLRVFRNKLYTNCLQLQRAIEEYFPSSTKISQPQGGFMLWLELDKKIDTTVLYENAMKHKISFAPGRMFSQYNQYDNCMRLSFALEWNDKVDFALKRLGKSVKDAL